MSVEKPSSAGIQEELLDITSCCICLQGFTDPRILPCIHTFCRKCLEDIVEKSGKGNGDVLPCPMCRREFVIPPDGVAALEKNFFMVRLVEMSRNAFVQPPGFCDSCIEDSVTENPPAEMFCQDCSLKLCESCCKHHRKLKLTMDHKLVALQEQSEVLLKMNAEFCEQHEKERLKFYCSDCAMAVCAFCFVQSHQSHKWKDIQTTAGEFREQIQNVLKNISKNGSGLTARKRELSETVTDVVKGIQLVEDAINERKAFMKDLIDKHSDLLLAKLEEKLQEKTKEITAEDETIESQMSNQSSYSVYCEEITVKGSDVDVCRAHPDIKQRGKELNKLGMKMCKQKLPQFKGFLKTTPFEDLLKDSEWNLIGSIEGVDVCLPSKDQIPKPTEESKSTTKSTTEKSAKSKKEKAKSSDAGKKPSSNQRPDSSPQKSASSSQPPSPAPGVPFPFIPSSGVRHNFGTKPVVKIVLSKKDRITGMATLEEELFVITERNSIFEVYNLSAFTFKRSSTVQGLVKPDDMVASSESKCLFIFDADSGGKILQVDRHTGSVIHQCLTGSTAMSLSITPENNILATYLGKNKLKEYCFSSPPKLVNTIVLASGGTCCAVKRTTGAYLVSRGQDSTGQVPHGVFELDSSCKAVRKFFVGQQGSHFGTLTDPGRLVSDRFEWVMVADKITKRVLLLNPDLKFERVLLLEHHGLYDPQRITFDESTHCLFVADYDQARNVGRIHSVQSTLALA